MCKLIMARPRFPVTVITHIALRSLRTTLAFGEAPPPKQGLFNCPNRAFREWWVHHLKRPPLLTGEVTLCFGALQGYPEASHLWEHHADKIICTPALKSTIHELCLYSGFVQDKRVLICRQVDNFAVAVSAECIANIIFDHIDDLLPSPLTKMGLITLFTTLTSSRQETISRSWSRPTLPVCLKDTSSPGWTSEGTPLR